MVTIKAVEIEGFHNTAKKQIEFHKTFNYLHGQNGAGKSTILEAIQLALLGYIPGTDKNKSSIFAHASSRLMSVTLHLYDDRADANIQVKREWIQAGSNIIPSVTITPAVYDIEALVSSIELPIFNFNEFVGMTANKLKDWFINFLPRSEFHTDWDAVLCSEAHKNNINVSDDFIREQVAAIADLGCSGVDEIRAANKRFKELTSQKKAELERLTSTIQSLIYYEDVTNLNEQQLTDEYHECMQKYQDAVKYTNIKATNEQTLKMLEEYADLCEDVEKDAEYTDKRAATAELTTKLLEVEDQIRDARSNYEQLRAELEQKRPAVSDSGVCPFTKVRCDTILAVIDEAKHEYEICSNAAEAAFDKLETLQHQRDDIYAEHRKLVDELDATTLRYTTRNQLQTLLKSVPDGLTELDLDASYWADKANETNNLLVKVRTNKEYNRLIDTVTKEKFTLSSELDACKAWDKLTGVNGLQQNNDGEDPFEKLVAQMLPNIQSLFGSSVTPEFLRAGKANSFSFGIEKEDFMSNRMYIPYDMLSSGEKCLFTLALLMSIIRCSQSPLKLIMIDDLFDHLDDRNIDNVFKSLLNVQDIQMIFAGVKIPEDKQYQQNMQEI